VSSSISSSGNSPEAPLKKQERLFIALPLDGETRSAVSKELKKVRNLPGKIIPEENWHITLFFLGSVEAAQKEELCDVLEQTDFGSSFEIMFKHFMTLGSPSRPHVFCLEIKQEGEHLRKLADKIICAVEKVGFEREKRDFRAHLTLSRLKEERVNLRSFVDSLQSLKPCHIKMKANRIVLFQSHLESGKSVVYKEIRSWELSSRDCR